jgi:hypothetical protein
VSIEKPSTPQPSYGVIWLSARTEVDKATRLVTLEDVHITKGRFPTERDAGSAALAAIGGHLAGETHTIALDRLEASLRIQRDAARTAALPLANDPPRIFVSRVPALLVLIDGPPVLLDAPDTTLRRVINTRALLAFDSQRDRYFLDLADRWLEAHALEGPWTPVATPPSGLDALKASAVEAGDVELLDDDPEIQALLGRNELPAVYVSTRPPSSSRSAASLRSCRSAAPRCSKSPTRRATSSSIRRRATTTCCSPAAGSARTRSMGRGRT